MQNINFPVDFLFNITTFSNDFTATDANGHVIAYVKQKMFKLKEAITIYDNDSKTNINYTINADRWIDFSAAYSIKHSSGKELGKIARKGWRSLWKTEYDLIDQNQQPQFKIREENAWVKVWDSLVGEIPIIGAFTGYFFNPSYLVIDNNGETVAKLSKEKSLLGRRFKITKIKEFDGDDAERIMLGLMMMVLLERRKG